MVFNRLVQKHWHFQACCEDSIKKFSLCPLKNRELIIFQLTTGRKNLEAEKFAYDRSRERRSFTQKPDKTDK